MTNLNLDKLLSTLKGKRVERPNKKNAGTLSGHAAGEPFEKLVYHSLKDQFGADKVFKQYEFLNDIFLAHPKHITVEQRHQLFNSLTALFLFCRGDKATKDWSPENIFEEKQDDTADTLYIDGNTYCMIDVKSANIDKHAQAPNIIYAYKLARTCAIMLDNEEFDSVDIRYVGINWKEEGDQLVCVSADECDLFKADPSTLYINWAAGMQIQFHVSELDQSWHGTRKEWAVEYLRTFTKSATRRCDLMKAKYIDPFLKYLN